jgi:hypothetical protein
MNNSDTLAMQYIERKLEEFIIGSNAIVANDNAKQMREFIDVGEYGLALLVACDTIRSQKINLSDHFRELIIELANRMELDETEWKDLVESPGGTT